MSEPSVREALIRAIIEGERAGSKLTELTISDAAARQLAEELVLMQMMPKTTAAEIYAGLKAGTSKFMDRKVMMTE